MFRGSKRFRRSLAVVILATATVIAIVSYFMFYTPEQITLLSWSADSDLKNVSTNHSSVDLLQDNGQWRMRMETSEGLKFSGVTITPQLEKWWDGNNYQWVTFDVTNVGDYPCEVGVRIEGITKSPSRNLSDRVCLVMPGETRRARANVFATPWTYDNQIETRAMRIAPGQPLLPGYGLIKSVSVYVRHAGVNRDHQLLVGDIRLETPMRIRSSSNLFPIVDCYGQLRTTKWPGKIQSDQQLIGASRKEQSELKATKRPGTWSKYGGWVAGPKLEATGAFRTEKVDGRWWLVDPDGNLFWSHGVACVATEFSATGVQGRENYFQWLPPNNVEIGLGEDSDPLGDFYHQAQWAHAGYYKNRVPYWSYNFLLANLFRQFGRDWQYGFADLAHLRLQAWRMNTMAAWSDPLITSWKKTPYTELVRIANCPFIEGSQSAWQKFVDVFAPEFEGAVVSALKTRGAAFDDPWCIGFFVDNELSWGDAHSLADGVMRSPATQPAKQQWINFLKQRYSTIEALNKTWQFEFENWEKLLELRNIPHGIQNQQSSLEDRTAFSLKIMERYFSTIASKLDELAPDRLYLGCRFFWHNDDAFRIAARYCDVVSINHYRFLSTDVSLPNGVDKPIVIGEFHFGATDRGMLHPTNLPAEDQADRAANYIEFVESALRNPAIVGTHWFQYVDNPVTGRGDKNNANNGLISITHTPYPELVEAVTEVGGQMYEIRSSANSDTPSVANDRDITNVKATR